MPTNWDDFTVADDSAEGTDWSQFTPDQPDIKLNPYDVARLQSPGPMTPFGPPNPQEVATVFAPVLNAEMAGLDLLKQGASAIGRGVVRAADVPTDIANRMRGATQGVGPYVPRLNELPRPQLATVDTSELGPDQTGLQVAAGVGNLLAGTANQLVPPFAPPEVGLTLPLLGGEGAIPRIASGVYGAAALADLPDQLEQAVSVIKDPNVPLGEKIQAAGQPILNTGFGALMLKHALTKGVPDASTIKEAAKVYGDMRPLAGEGEGKVSTKESGEGIQPQTKEGVQDAAKGPERILLTPEWADKLPPTPVGVTRVFHGEGGAEGGGLGGAWFTTNPERAASHGESVSYVDVPDAVAESSAVPGTKGDVDLSKYPELLKQSQPVEGAKAKVHEIKEEPGPKPTTKQPDENVPAPRDTLNLETVKTLTPAVMSADGRMMTDASHVEAARKIMREWEQAPGEQGFKTDTGHFITRAQGAEVFKRLEPNYNMLNPHGLYSEDLAGSGRLSHLDAVRYDDLVKEMKAALKRADFDTFTRIQREVEQIKNRQKKAGYAPAKEPVTPKPTETPATVPPQTPPTPVPKPPTLTPESTIRDARAVVSTFGPIQQAVESLEKATAPAVRTAYEAVKAFGKEALGTGKMTDYRRAVLNWSAKLQRSFGEAAEFQRDIQKRVPDPVRREAITNWIQAGGDTALLARRAAQTADPKLAAGYMAATKLTPEELAVANHVKGTFNTLGRKGQAYDVVHNFLQNYTPQIWDLGKSPGFAGARTLRDKFKFDRARSFDTFFDGEQAGYVPKTKDISKLLPVYSHEMNTVIAARELVQEMSKGKALDGRPLVATRGAGVPVDGPQGQATLVLPKVQEADIRDYKALENQPALNGWKWVSKDTAGNPVFSKSDLVLHPDAYARIKAVLGKSAIREWYQTKTSVAAEIPKKIVQGLDIANSVTKRTMLGLLAPFHQVQEATHAIGHRVNPMFGIPKIDLVRDVKQIDAAKHGLMLLPDRVTESQFMEGFKTSGLVSKLPGIGPLADHYSNYLFHEYIPGLKYKTYSAILGRNEKVYAPDVASGKLKPEDVKVLSAEQTNAAFGHLNFADLGRNPTIQHIMQLGLLAPDFLEARARFAGQSIKGLTSAKVGREQLVALATLAVAQAGLAYTSAKLTGGTYDPKRPFEMVLGNRRYTLRSVPEDVSSALSDTRKFIHSRLSPIIGKGALQYASGVNYRGQRVTAGQTTKELLQQPIPISARGFLEIGNSPLSGWEQLLGAVGLRVSRYSPASEVTKLADKWRETASPKQQSVLARRQQEVLPDSDLSKLRDDLGKSDFKAAHEEYNRLLESKKASDIFKTLRPFTVVDRGGEYQRHEKGFAGLSMKDQREFEKTLSPSDKVKVRDARKERDDEFKKFQELLKSERQLQGESVAAPY